MTTCEWMALPHILAGTQPKCAIEVRAEKGLSLQALAYFCVHVDSIDIDPSVVDKLVSRFSNVTFHTGSSASLLPSFLRSDAQDSEPISFVLIDGDHSTDGVRGATSMHFSACRLHVRCSY
jgi:hypothetical protein